MAMALHALADDIPVKHIERREKGGDAVPLIVVGDGASTSLFHRQPWLGAVQRLGLAFLINREQWRGRADRRRGQRSLGAWPRTADLWTA